MVKRSFILFLHGEMITVNSPQLRPNFIVQFYQIRKFNNSIKKYENKC